LEEDLIVIDISARVAVISRRDWKTTPVTQPSEIQWSLYVPPGLTFNNPTFCPHSVFMCFVWI